MTPENLEASIRTVKQWAQEEIERLVYAGTRPVSICSTVESATREAAIARGNAIAHSGEIAEIEALSNLCDRALERVSIGH
jgi:hypothetical protein